MCCYDPVNSQGYLDMKASKKDFVALAVSLRTLREDLNEATAENIDNLLELAWRKHVKEVARICGQANPAFRHSTFYDACGMP